MHYLYLPLAALGGYMFIFSTLTTEQGVRLGALLEKGAFLDGTPVRHTYTHVPILDAGLSFLVGFFYEYIDGSNPDSREFSLYFFLGLLVPFLGLLAIESSRGHGRLLFPWMAAMQLLGFCTVSPLFYFYFSHSGAAEAPATPALPAAGARAIAPALAIAVIAPTVAMFAAAAPQQRQAVIAFWQGLPIWYALGHALLSRALRAEPRRERVYVSRVYSLLTLVAAAAHVRLLRHVLAADRPWSAVVAVFWPARDVRSVADASLLLLAGDWAIGLLATMAWVVGQVWREMDAGFGRKLAVLPATVLASVLLGPGVVLAECWRWREGRLRERMAGKKRA